MYITAVFQVAAEMTCNTQECLSYNWEATPWGKCSKRCGGGVKWRKVQCMGSDGEPALTRHCNALGTARQNLIGIFRAHQVYFTWPPVYVQSMIFPDTFIFGKREEIYLNYFRIAGDCQNINRHSVFSRT